MSILIKFKKFGGIKAKIVSKKIILNSILYKDNLKELVLEWNSTKPY